MMASAQSVPAYRKRKYWITFLVLALLGYGCVRAVCFRFGMVAWTDATVDVAAISAALDEFADAHSKQYPADLLPLVTPDEAGNCYLEGYNGKFPKDPWKHEYQYMPPTPAHPKPRVISFGADGKPGGSGDEADLDSDQLCREH